MGCAGRLGMHDVRVTQKLRSFKNLRDYFEFNYSDSDS